MKNNEKPGKTIKSLEKQQNTMKNSENGSILTLTANQDALMNHPFNQEQSGLADPSRIQTLLIWGAELCFSGVPRFILLIPPNVVITNTHTEK